MNIATNRNKEVEIVLVMNDRRIDLLVMAERRQWGSDDRRDLGEGYTLMYKGFEVKGRRHIVAMIMGQKLTLYIQEVKLVKEILMSCRVKIKGKIPYTPSICTTTEMY